MCAQYSRTIDNLDVTNGQTVTEEAYDELNAEQSVTIRDGGTATFSAGKRIVLKPGFHAEQGSSFTADFSYDSDFDGLPTAWESLYGLDPLLSNAYQDNDGDGIINIVEYLLGTSPVVADAPTTWPSNTIADDLIADAATSGFSADLLLVLPGKGLFLVKEEVTNSPLYEQ